jgi:hypothetical protein
MKTPIVIRFDANIIRQWAKRPPQDSDSRQRMRQELLEIAERIDALAHQKEQEHQQ